jgi:hypothetical protein
MEILVILCGLCQEKNKANPSTSLRTSLFVLRAAYCVYEFEKTKPIFRSANGRKSCYIREIRKFPLISGSEKQSQSKPVQRQSWQNA